MGCGSIRDEAWVLEDDGNRGEYVDESDGDDGDRSRKERSEKKENEIKRKKISDGKEFRRLSLFRLEPFLL